MLKELNRDQAQFVAALARAARARRDSSIAGVPEADLTETKPARGEHNPTAEFGVRGRSGRRTATHDDARRHRQAVTCRAVRALCADARRARPDCCKKWNRGIADAGTLGDDTITAALMDDPDLHDHLMEGLYETKQAS